jgi:hypothetical protein
VSILSIQPEVIKKDSDTECGVRLCGGGSSMRDGAGAGANGTQKQARNKDQSVALDRAENRI